MTIKPLLELIAQAESHGNPNAYYGNVSNQDNPEFTAMTIGQVTSWQRDFVNRGSPSSAVGKYQFLRKTLSDLARQFALATDEVLTEELQDFLAVGLATRRGWYRFADGRLPVNDFANNLAKEWASLPVVDGPKQGRSYYSGDGLNKALVSVEEMLECLAGCQSEKK